MEFTRKLDFRLTRHSDSDRAGCVKSQKSTGGYCFSLASAMIPVCNKKQPAAALSSANAEYRATVKAVL
jgi:hypothetical protein